MRAKLGHGAGKNVSFPLFQTLDVSSSRRALYSFNIFVLDIRVEQCLFSLIYLDTRPMGNHKHKTSNVPDDIITDHVHVNSEASPLNSRSPQRRSGTLRLLTDPKYA